MPPFSITIGSTGITAPDTPTIRAGYSDVWKSAYPNLNTDASTPQGQIITSETAIMANVMANMLALFNSFNPRTASAPMQDYLANIFLLERFPATSSIAYLVVYGLTGKVIPAGTQFQNENGEVFVSSSAYTITNSGVPDMKVVCQTPGAVPVPADSITKIIPAVQGIDSVNNTSAGTIGSDTETREAFDIRIQNTISKNAEGSLSAILSNVLSLPDVSDAVVWENRTDEEVTYRGVTLEPHSVYLCVLGGTSSEIGDIFLKKLDCGGTNGSKTATVVDSLTGVSYSFKYDNPTRVPVYFAITVNKIDTGLSDSEIIALVKSAVVAQFNNGLGKYQKISIADTVYASRFYCGVNAIDGIEAESILIGTATGDRTHTSVVPLLKGLPTISSANIAVTVG